MKFAVVSGTLADGFKLIGPFPHQALATEWADTWEEDITWEVCPIIEPSKLEQERMK